MLIEVVLSTIKLDDQSVLHADKINDEPAARGLPSEVVSSLSPGAKVNPKLYLLRRHGLAQPSRNWVRHCPHPVRYARHPPPAGEGWAVPVAVFAAFESWIACQIA